MAKRTKPAGVGISSIPWNLTNPDRGCMTTDVNGNRVRKSLYGPGRLPDWAIFEFISIKDFVDYGDCPPGVVSYGLTSGGYDLRVGYKFKVFTNAWCERVSPKNISPKCFLDVDLTPEEFPEHTWIEPGAKLPHACARCGEEIIDPKLSRTTCKPQKPQSILIPPNCFALAETIEHLSVPRNVMCICLGKSTYARCGINMNFTPFEPGWRGIVTVEIINATPCPVEIFAGQGIGQCLFDLMAGDPEIAYADKANAKYQDQTGLTLPTVK